MELHEELTQEESTVTPKKNSVFTLNDIPSVVFMRRLIVMLAILLVLLAGRSWYQGLLMDVTEERDYNLSQVILLQEQQFLLKYGFFAEEVPILAEYRDAWMDKPCYETALAYSKMLDRVLNIEDVPEEELLPEEGAIFV